MRVHACAVVIARVNISLRVTKSCRIWKPLSVCNLEPSATGSAEPPAPPEANTC